MTTNNISRDSDFSNVGSIQKLFFILEKHLVNVPYLPNTYNNNVQIDETLNVLVENRANILELYFTPGTIQFSETSKQSRKGTMYAQKLILDVPKDSIEKSGTIQAISNNKVFLYYEDRNGKFKVLRNMRMTSDLSIGNGNRYKLTFVHESKQVAKFVDTSEVVSTVANVGDDSMRSYENAARKGSILKVEDYPLLWINENYFNIHKGNIFKIAGDGFVYAGNEFDYAAVTDINLNNQSLTTNFTFLDKFSTLINLRLNDNNINEVDFSKIYNKSLIHDISIKNNNISICNLQGFVNAVNVLIHTNNISIADFSDLSSVERLEFYANNIDEVDLSNCSNLDILIGYQNNLNDIDLNNNTLLTELLMFSNSIQSIDLSNNTLLTKCRIQSNDLDNIDLSNNTLLTDVRLHNNQLTASTNSQLLIDLDTHGLSNGYFQSTIFGGGTLTAAGLTAKNNLQAKGWNIVGL